jgi:hypothetical protein
MTFKKAVEILNTEDSISIEEISQALEVVRNKETKKTIDPTKSQNAHASWKKRKQEEFTLKKELKKYYNP